MDYGATPPGSSDHPTCYTSRTAHLQARRGRRAGLVHHQGREQQPTDAACHLRACTDSAAARGAGWSPRDMNEDAALGRRREVEAFGCALSVADWILGTQH